MTLGEKLQTLRRSRGLSQEQLAEILEVSRQAVSKWENGDSAPDLDRLRAICTYFGVTTDYLIWDEPEDAPRGAEEAPRGAEEARSREAQKKPLRETVREHSEWAGYAVAILGAAMLLRALPGMILQMLLLGSNIAPGAATNGSALLGLLSMYLPYLAVYALAIVGGLLLARWLKKRKEAHDDL